MFSVATPFTASRCEAVKVLSVTVIVNLQRKFTLETKALRHFVADLRTTLPEAEDRTFSVAFISDRRMKELNKFFRGKNATTDVLSFPHEPDEFTSAYENTELPSADGQPPAAFLGDIVISVEQAQKQAAENDLTLEGEIKQLILHGLLHLCGYDHETDDGEMNRRERHLRRKLKI